MERDLFSLDPSLKGRNKRIFWEVVNELPDGATIAITPFTHELRRRGCGLSEESCSRYMRFARLQWNWEVDFQALGKGRYRVVKNGIQ
jgi:hypothetical protein